MHVRTAGQKKRLAVHVRRQRDVAVCVHRKGEEGREGEEEDGMSGSSGPPAAVQGRGWHLVSLCVVLWAPRRIPAGQGAAACSPPPCGGGPRGGALPAWECWRPLG